MVSRNNIKPDPVGIDRDIQDIQGELYKFLVAKWGGPIQGFGRAYKNTEGWQAAVPEWYKGSDYVPVYFDDSYACNFFFLEEQNHDTKDEVVFDAKVKLVFMLDLKKVRPDLADPRPDEHVRIQMLKFLREISDSRYTITGIQKGIDAVFAGYDKSKIQLNDFGKKHTFAVRLTLTYYTNDC